MIDQLLGSREEPGVERDDGGNVVSELALDELQDRRLPTAPRTGETDHETRLGRRPPYVVRKLGGERHPTKPILRGVVDRRVSAMDLEIGVVVGAHGR
jgi:hypothetical protein